MRGLFGEDLTRYIYGGGDASGGFVEGNNGKLEMMGLSVVRVVNSDEVVIIGEDGGEGDKFKTLRGILREVLRQGDGGFNEGDDDVELSDDIFTHIQSQKKTIFNWDIRGKRIFNLVTNNRGLGKDVDEQSKTSRFSSDSLPDFVVLQEYDVHGTDPSSSPSLGNVEDVPLPQDYLCDGIPRSFGSSMKLLGYHSLLFESPSKQHSGIGVFANSKVFDVEGETCDGPIWRKVEAGEFNEGADSISRLKSIDLMELSPISGKVLRSENRKNVAICPLVFKSNPEKNVVLFGTHLMTTSRDATGEVRMSELEKIKSLAKNYLKDSNDIALFCGDFNINLRGECNSRFIFEGRLPPVIHTDDGAFTQPGPFHTGYAIEKVPKTDNNKSDSDTITPSEEEVAVINWSREDGTNLKLLDAYEGINTQCFNEQGQVVGSSRNAERIDLIDYCWYQSDRLRLKRKSELILDMEDGIPDEKNPSDHIPIVVEFEVK